jgi:hypothetical protein
MLPGNDNEETSQGIKGENVYFVARRPSRRGSRDEGKKSALAASVLELTDCCRDGSRLLIHAGIMTSFGLGQTERGRKMRLVAYRTSLPPSLLSLYELSSVAHEVDEDIQPSCRN